MYTFLALGDSYTIGEGVLPQLNFPSQTVQLLRNGGYNMAEPLIIAKTGWTTDELTAELDQRQLDAPFDFVTLLIGVNNQYRGHTTDNYGEEFHDLLHRALAYAGGRADRVVVLSIPDWGVTPFAHDRDAATIALELDAYNEVNRYFAQDHGCPYLDITPGTRQNAAKPGFLADDGLHPSAAEYTEWSVKLSDMIVEKLQSLSYL